MKTKNEVIEYLNSYTYYPKSESKWQEITISSNIEVSEPNQNITNIQLLVTSMIDTVNKMNFDENTLSKLGEMKSNWSKYPDCHKLLDDLINYIES